MRMARASKYISDSEVVETRMRELSEWRILINYGLLSCIFPCELSANYCRYVKFPQYIPFFFSFFIYSIIRRELLKRGTIKKVTNNVFEIARYLKTRALANTQAIQLQYCPMLARKIQRYLIKEDEIGIERVV